MSIQAWKPARRTRKCAALDCNQREAIRTTAILTNGVPISLCTRCWKRYAAQLPVTVTVLDKPP